MGDMMDHPDLLDLELADHLRQLDEPSGLWTDKQGRSIGMVTANRLLKDDSYKVVGSDILVSPCIRVWVSTVWTGTDYDFGRTGVPLLFETMVFPAARRRQPWYDHYQLRWSTEEQAKEGHALMVEAVRLDRSELWFVGKMAKLLALGLLVGRPPIDPTLPKADTDQ